MIRRKKSEELKKPGGKMDLRVFHTKREKNGF